MNHAQIDPLLPLPLPPPREPATPSRPHDPNGAFDRHFQSARPWSTPAPLPPPSQKQFQHDDSAPHPEPPDAESQSSASDSSAIAPPATQSPQDGLHQAPAKNATVREAASLPVRDEAESAATSEPAAVGLTIRVPAGDIEPGDPKPIATHPTVSNAEKPSRLRSRGPHAQVLALATAQRRPAATTSHPATKSDRASAVPQVAGRADLPAEPAPDQDASQPVEVQPAAKTGADAPLVAKSAGSDVLLTQSDPSTDATTLRPDDHASRPAPQPRETRHANTPSTLEAVEPGTRRPHILPTLPTGNERPTTTNVATAGGDPPPVPPNERPAPTANDAPSSSAELVLDAEPATSQQRLTPPLRAPLPAVALAAAATPALANEVSPGGGAEGASNPASSPAETRPGLLAALARIDRTAPLNAHATHGGQSKPMPHVDPARFVNRVARAIHTAQDRGGPLVLRLSPPELGSLRLELSLQQGVLSASIEADNSLARQMLLDNLPTLRDRLADQNVRIERFDVDLRRDGEGRDPSNFHPHQQKQHQQHAPHHRPASGREPPVPEPSAAPTTPIRSITDTTINIVA